MLIEIKYADKGGFLRSGGKSPIYGLKLGPKNLTPKTVVSEVHSVSHSILSPRDAASGLASGKRQHSPILLVVTKKTDSSSANLYQQCISGNQAIPRITFNFWSSLGKGNGQPSFKIELTNATVVSHRRGVNPPGNSRNLTVNIHSVEFEEFQLRFDQITATNIESNTFAAGDWLTA
jgi:type VI secretion system secreted protein Hcp